MTGRKSIPIHYLFLIVFGAFFVFIMVMPYVWMLLNTFKRTQELLRNPFKMLPLNWTLSSYVTVFKRTPFFSWFKNSVITTVSVTSIVLFSSSIAGFVFAKFKFPGRTLLFWVILASMMVPFQTIMIPNFLIVNHIGLYNTLFALIVPNMVSGFGIFLCRQFCEGIPDSLWEAALIDGASNLSIYLNIIVPLLRPCLAALAIFSFLGTWNEYLQPLIMLENVKNMTLPIALAYFTNGPHIMDISACLAAAALIMIPVTVVFLLFQKHFIKGAAISGMK
ncbi:MAG: carbohydrate ABC transporter permease [Treponema sp.]|jgi:ABC-type glycerol-3-phosphate transport system permease component|nr:carbohydrate ABC transporter permease [Treponema sp.]